MPTNLPADVTSIRMHLNELKSKIDRAIREGSQFEEIRKMYTEINELQCHLTALQWTPLTSHGQGRGGEEIRLRHAEEANDDDLRGN